MVVEGASMDHGLLHIDVERPEPARMIRDIPIRTTG
jgi:HSP20 family molecular chaperone IbpA